MVAPLTPAFDVLRMGLGFDLTAVLAIVNLALFAAWWMGLPSAMRAPMAGGDTAYRGSRPVA